jgi:hypothetical protein
MTHDLNDQSKQKESAHGEHPGHREGLREQLLGDANSLEIADSGSPFGVQFIGEDVVRLVKLLRDAAAALPSGAGGSAPPQEAEESVRCPKCRSSVRVSAKTLACLNPKCCWKRKRNNTERALDFKTRQERETFKLAQQFASRAEQAEAERDALKVERDVAIRGWEAAAVERDALKAENAALKRSAAEVAADLAEFKEGAAFETAEALKYEAQLNALEGAVKAKAEEWRERGDYIKANAEFADANLTPSHSERGDAFIEMADELDALLSSPVSPQTPQKHRLEPISTSADNRPSPIIPQIPLDDAAQEQIAKQWAADDRLWTTQETVAFNLRVFARAIIASKPAASEDCIQTSDAAMTLHYYGRPLTVKVENGQLVIAIGVQTLAHAVTYSEWANQWEDEAGDYFRTFAITDAVEFGKDVVHAMLNEREDGSTPLSDFLDRMTEAAVEDGSVSCEYEQHIPNGTTAASETWAADEQEREGEEPR